MVSINNNGTRGQRKYRRVEVDARARVGNKVRSANPSPLAKDAPRQPNGGWQAKVTNLSLRGAAVRGDTELLSEVGKRIELVLPAVDGEDIVLVSRVVRVQIDDDGFTSGVRFSHASTEDKMRFLTLIRMLLTARD